MMSFTMDDVMQALNVVKECGDCELHIDTGDMKLSIWKGNTGDGAGSPLAVSRGSILRVAEQPVSEAALATDASVQGDEPKAAIAIAAPAEVATGDQTIPEGMVPITASVTSVFYRKPSPEEPPFVEIGSEVEADSVVCLLEVMKCYRSVNAGVNGRVEKILAESGQLVEYGTVLFLIRPS